MAEGVQADSAERALASLEVEFDSETLQDCFTLYFDVVSGDPRDHLRDLQAATQAWGVGVSLNGQVFAGLCASDPSVSISQGTGLPGLEYDHMRWYTLESILHVPAGEEDEWVVRLLQEGFISAAGQVTWCTD